jgi:predicted dehydrogenase
MASSDDMTSVRVGLLGTGYWARQVHAPGIARSGAEFTGVWGRRLPAADEVAAEAGTRAFGRLEDLLDAVDIVSIAVPPTVQPDLIVQAAEAGCHILLEKPVALTTHEAGQALEVVKRANRASIVFLTRRFFPPMAAWLSELGTSGGWEGARVEILSSALAGTGPYGESQWRRDAGALWDIGPHALSVVTAVLGPAAAVAARPGVRDETHLVVSHRSGATSTISVSLTASEQATADSAYFYGAAGRSSQPEFHVDLDVLRSTYGLALAALVEQADSGVHRHPCDIELGCELVDVLSAAQQSFSSGAVEVVSSRAN